MTRGEVKEQIRLQCWEAMIRERTARGLSVAEYCGEIGIATNTYYHRVKRVRDAVAKQLTKTETAPGAAISQITHAHNADATDVPAGWAIARIEEPIKHGTHDAPEGTIELRIDEITIRVQNGTNLELLREVCRTLKTL